MRQVQGEITVQTPRRGVHEITHQISAWLAGHAFEIGLLTVFCRHTSASLLITENASPAVRRDLDRWLARLAPESDGYEHDDEGVDDMPAHLRAAITATSLSIPLAGGKMALGTWQGVFPLEHRARPHRRRITLHAIGG